MLNATLILVALCLWLAWGAFSTLERVTGTVQEVTSSLHPLRDELIVLKTDITETRASIAALREGGVADLQLCTNLEGKLTGLEERADNISETLRSIEAGLAPAIENAVETTFDRIGQSVAGTILGWLGLEKKAGDTGS